uniref:Protein orai n=1 Tax=Acrobeloides nanus TaxID=290746 RepID=A0A914DY35_9BILA
MIEVEQKNYLHIKSSPSNHLLTSKSTPSPKPSFYSDNQQYYLTSSHSTNGDLPYTERQFYIPVRNETDDQEKNGDELTSFSQYRYELSRKQLKASSNISALLAGFAMVALVELHYPKDTPHALLIILAIVTTLLVSVHLLALMMSTCILPYIEATGCTKDSPHIKLKFYIELSWIFSTCLGLVLFLLEIVLIFYMKFLDINFEVGAYITTIMLVPVFIMFGVISYLIHRSIVSYSVGRGVDKIDEMTNILIEKELMHKSNKAQQNHVVFGLDEETTNVKHV